MCVDEPMFQEGKVTVSTIMSAKGHTAVIVHFIGVEQLDRWINTGSIDERQESRAQFHVAATRATLRLELWGGGWTADA